MQTWQTCLKNLLKFKIVIHVLTVILWKIIKGAILWPTGFLEYSCSSRAFPDNAKLSGSSWNRLDFWEVQIQLDSNNYLSFDMGFSSGKNKNKMAPFETSITWFIYFQWEIHLISTTLIWMKYGAKKKFMMCYKMTGDHLGSRKKDTFRREIG